MNKLYWLGILCLFCNHCSCLDVIYMRTDDIIDKDYKINKDISQLTNKMWCYVDERRPLLGFREIWSDITFQVEGDGCLVGESSSTFFNVDTFRDIGNREENVVERLKLKTIENRDQAFSRLVENYFRFGCAKNITFSTFGKSCVKLVPESGGKITRSIKIRKTNFRMLYPLLFLSGYMLLVLGPYVSEKLVFYYVSGVSLGVILSVFLISWFVLKRVVPGKNSVFLALLFQSLFGAFAFIGDLFKTAILEHPDIVLWYLGISIVVSFAITHLMLRSGTNENGPNAGLKDLVRWGLQGLGYLSISCSTRSVEWSISLIICVLTYRIIFPMFGERWNRLLFWINPDRDVAVLDVRYIARPFLTEEQYKQEAVICTDKAKREMFKSRAFQDWLLQNADRIQLAPTNNNNNNNTNEDEIEDY